MATRCECGGRVIRGDANADSARRDFSIRSRRSAVAAPFASESGNGPIVRYGIPVLFYEVKTEVQASCFARVRWCQDAKHSERTQSGLVLLKKEGRESFSSLVLLEDLVEMQVTLCTTWVPGYDFSVVCFPRKQDIPT